jgi:hypothetical protein
VRRREAFEHDPAGFCARWDKDAEKIRKKVLAARKRLHDTPIPDGMRQSAAQLCMALGTDGLRGDMTLMRAARACAALQGDAEVTRAHLRQVAAPALRHRLRRHVLDDTGSTARVERAVAELQQEAVHALRPPEPRSRRIQLWGGLIFWVTTLYCGYMSYILVKAARHALPSMRNPELWNEERMRQRNVRQRRMQAG